MPPPIVKKPKGREGRQSRSRNTTPSSAAEVPTSSIIPANTAYTEISIASLQVPSNISYDDILERHGGAGGIPDPSHLTTMAKDLKHLSDLASSRGDACNQGMRVLSEKRKGVLEEEREKELEREQALALRARESEERRTLKREAEDDEDVKERKSGKQKKQRKERSAVRDPERPLNHGAHGLARQDGLDLPLDGELRTFLLSATIYITCRVTLFDTPYDTEPNSLNVSSLRVSLPLFSYSFNVQDSLFVSITVLPRSFHNA